MSERPSFQEIYLQLAATLAKRSTCCRLQVGTVITSEDFRKVLAVGYNGNATGLPNTCDREEPGNCGCFPPNVLVQTDKGEVPIQDLKVGDSVLTHMGRYRPVTAVLRRDGAERVYVKLSAGHKHENACRFVSTIDHPVMVERAGQMSWVKAGDLVIGDVVLRNSTPCRDCKEPIPDFRILCNSCFRQSANTVAWRERTSKRMKANNPMKNLYGPRQKLDNGKVESLVSRQKLGQKKLSTNLFQHIKDQGLDKKYRCIVVDHIGERPDIILIDWDNRKVIAYEYERHTRNIKPEKFKKHNQFDDVRWHIVNVPQGELGLHNGFSKVRVRSFETMTRTSPIYNLEVEEDNSYVCQGLVVHNCLHSEENAVINCDSPRSTPKIVFVTHQPCVACAKRLINLGNVRKVYYGKEYRSTESKKIFELGGIELEQVAFLIPS